MGVEVRWDMGGLDLCPVGTPYLSFNFFQNQISLFTFICLVTPILVPYVLSINTQHSDCVQNFI